MVQLIIYGVIAAVLLGGAYAVRSSIEEKGAAKQRAKDEPIIAACQADLKTAQGANDTLRMDVLRIGVEREAQNAAVQDLADRTKQAMVEREKALAFAQGKVAALQGDAAAMRQRLAQQPKPGVTCEQQLSSIDSTLRDLATRRVRDHPPAAGSRDQGGNPAAGQNPGAGEVRIRP